MQLRNTFFVKANPNSASATSANIAACVALSVRCANTSRAIEFHPTITSRDKLKLSKPAATGLQMRYQGGTTNCQSAFCVVPWGADDLINSGFGIGETSSLGLRELRTTCCLLLGIKTSHERTTGPKQDRSGQQIMARKVTSGVVRTLAESTYFWSDNTSFWIVNIILYAELSSG